MVEARAGGVVHDGDGNAHGLADVVAAARVLADELPAASPGSHVAFCFEHDHAAFLVALLATWQRGHAVALPSDARRFAVAATLSLPEVCRFLHDTGAGTGVCVSDRAWPVPTSNEGAVLAIGEITACTPEGIASVRRTGHSPAALRRLLVEYHARTALPAGATLVTTYDPGHLHALVPGLLGPLQRGARVVGGAGASGEQLAALAARHAASDLLTSAERLRELSRRPRGSLGSLRRAHSLGDVEPATAARCRDEHGIVVHSLAAVRAADLAARPIVQALLAVPGVADVAAVRVAVPGEGTPRWFVALAGRDLATSLLAAAASSACPGEPAACLQLVERIPRDHNGELPPDWVLHVSGRRPDGSRPARELVWHEEHRSAASWRTKVTLPGDYAGFDGHFLGYPVLSGSVQLHDVVLPALRRATGRELLVREFVELKFLARIAPADTVEVALEFGVDGASCTFVLARGDVKCTTGRVVWTVAGA